MFNRIRQNRAISQPPLALVYTAVKPLAGAVAIMVAGLFLLVNTAVAYGPHHTPASAYIGQGDRVVLNQELSVPAGSKVYLQNGEVMRRAGVKQSKPYCYFHLYRAQALLDTPATVSVGSFSIGSTQNRLEYVQRGAELLRVAGSIVTAGFVTQDASEQTMVTRITLHSETQPEVMHLNCAIWAVPNERNHPSLEEIRQALGELVTLQLSGE